MWKLTIEDDEGKQTSLSLAHEEYGLGRSEANAIRLTDRNISRQHAKLSNKDHTWIIQDIDSYNGTYVNGARVVGEQPLRHGDLVQLGDYRIEIVDESLVPQTTAAVAPGRATTISPLHSRPNRLVMVVGPSPGQEFSLEGERFSIGRSEDATISINHPSISRLHAELISLGGGRYEVVDKQSANGIRINGVELRRGLLEAGDALELGDVRLRFVGAGKIFRAGPDATYQPMVAVQAYDSSMSTAIGGAGKGPGSKGSSVARVIGILLVLGIVAGGLVFWLTRVSPTYKPDDTGVTSVTSLAAEQDALALRAAQDLFKKKEFDAAHEKLQTIAETSTLRDDPAFAEIEAGWADEMFRRYEQAESQDQKKELLEKIATTPTVDETRRNKALAELDKMGIPRPIMQPVTPRYTPPQPYTPPTPIQTTPTPTTTSAQPTGAPTNLDSTSYAAQRRQLEPKVWSGKASVEEIKLLRAICSHMGDKACRDRATAMLNQKKDSP